MNNVNMSKKCPKCGLINPETTLRCDCGYDFTTGGIKESYLSEKERLRLESNKHKTEQSEANLSISESLTTSIVGGFLVAIGLVIFTYKQWGYYVSIFGGIIGLYALINLKEKRRFYKPILGFLYGVFTGVGLYMIFYVVRFIFRAMF